MSAALAAQGVDFAYERGPRVLSGVSVGLARGEMAGIVGPNGSGKSTLLRVLAGTLRPRAGSVTLDGRPLARLGRLELARRLAFLPQAVTSVYALRVREVAAQGRFPHTGVLGLLDREDEEVVERSLARTESAELAERPFDSLSGGEKQRVLIASILAQEPEIMLLDEPTASLDIHHQTEVFDLLWGLSREGLAVAVVTHDLNLAAQFCDRLWLLEGGRIVEEGPPERVLRQEVLARVYRAELLVTRHPTAGAPMVVALRRRAGRGGGR